MCIHVGMRKRSFKNGVEWAYTEVCPNGHLKTGLNGHTRGYAQTVI
jgi:hypothetical protein